MDEQAKERLAKAGGNLRRIEEEIRPFGKKAPLRRQTTAGKWRETRDVVRKPPTSADHSSDS